MENGSFIITPFEGKRVRFDSTRSYEEVLNNLRKLVNTEVVQKANKLGLQVNLQNFGKVAKAEVTEEHFAELFKSLLGDHDFMLFFEIDHGSWLPAFGIKRMAIRWIFGNPLIAITMMKHDIGAGLFAPVEILLFENDSGKGSTIIYDLPSSLIATDKNPELLKAALALDRKLQNVISQATGVKIE